MRDGRISLAGASRAMTAAKSSVTARAAPGDYTNSQSLMLGLWLFDMWDGAGFSSMFQGDERHFMPRLLVGSCIAALKQRPLSITDAFIVMDAKHGRTAAKYIDLAVAEGLLTKIPDPGGDARKILLLPTEQLLRRFRYEMTRIGDDARELVAALAAESDGLPDTGAAEVTVRRKKNEPNRHAVRANGSTSFPGRTWRTGYYGPE
jgi:hypothetical protein